MNLRKAAGVTEQAMNVVYDVLRAMNLEDLAQARELSFVKFGGASSAQGELFRRQVDFTVERKKSGRW